MPLKLYMDHHVPRAITLGLRLRHVDVLTAYEDHAHDIADSDLQSFRAFRNSRLRIGQNHRHQDGCNPTHVAFLRSYRKAFSARPTLAVADAAARPQT